MRSTDVIRRPIVTEKSTWASSVQNRYTFEVDLRATKDDVKRAIHSLYGVRVQAVAVQKRKGQSRRSRFGYWRTKDMKRAIVKVHTDDRIELF